MFRLASNAFADIGSGGGIGKKITKSLGIGGLVPQDHCFGAWGPFLESPENFSGPKSIS